jgi:prolipoprotein diacylglyceryltransferase
LDLIIFGILLYLVLNKKIKKDGNLALIYLILYSIARIFVETCRIDTIRYICGISVAIITSVCIMFVSIILLILNNKNKQESQIVSEEKGE